MDYSYAFESRDFARIDKLNALTNAATFCNDVRKLCENTKSDHAIKRWQILAENRYSELTKKEVQTRG